MQYQLGVVFTVVLGCGGGDVEFGAKFEQPGPYVVGNTTIELTDAAAAES